VHVIVARNRDASILERQDETLSHVAVSIAVLGGVAVRGGLAQEEALEVGDGGAIRWGMRRA
jgi:hypothetical protein